MADQHQNGPRKVSIGNKMADGDGVEVSTSDCAGTSHWTKKRILKTVAVDVGYITVGCVYAIVGPTLLAVELWLDTTIEALGACMSFRGVGLLLGAGLCARFLRKFTHEIQFAFWMAILAVSIAISPWPRNVYVFAICLGVSYIAGSYCLTGFPVYLRKMWKGTRYLAPNIHLTQVFTAVGSFVSPLFVSMIPEVPKEETTNLNNTSFSQLNLVHGSIVDNQSDSSWMPNVTVSMVLTESNTSFMSNKTGSLLCSGNCTTDEKMQYLCNSLSCRLHKICAEDISVNCTNSTQEFQDVSNIDAFSTCFVYLFVGILATLPVLMFVYIIYASTSKHHIYAAKRDRRPSAFKLEKESMTLHYVIMVYTVFFGFLFMGVFTIPSDFLTVFIVTELKWSPSVGSLLTSVLWICHAVGRVACLILSLKVPPVVILLLNLSIPTVVMVCFCFIHSIPYTVVWILTCWLGLGVSSTYASYLVWVSKQTILSASVVGCFQCGTGVGVLFYGYTVSYIFENLGYMWFPYICLILMSTILVSFLIVLAFSYYSSRQNGMSNKTQLEHNGEQTEQLT